VVVLKHVRPMELQSKGSGLLQLDHIPKFGYDLDSL